MLTVHRCNSFDRSHVRVEYKNEGIGYGASSDEAIGEAVYTLIARGLLPEIEIEET